MTTMLTVLLLALLPILLIGAANARDARLVRRVARIVAGEPEGCPVSYVAFIAGATVAATESAIATLVGQGAVSYLGRASVIPAATPVVPSATTVATTPLPVHRLAIRDRGMAQVRYGPACGQPDGGALVPDAFASVVTCAGCRSLGQAPVGLTAAEALEMYG